MLFASSSFFPILALFALERSPPPPPPLDPSPPLLDIIFESEHIAVVTKPPNVPCHHLEVRSNKRKRTIVPDKDGEEMVIPVLQRARATFPHHDSIHLVHRLDRPTSGCLLIAFSSEAAREASEALAVGQKTYYALCRGNGESLRQRGVFRAEGDVKDSRGKIKTGALTEIECLGGTDGPPQGPRRCCLVRCNLHTGYWHQIRQHLGRENHPIVGENRHHPDRKENKFWRDELGLLPKSRVCLHCHRIVLENICNAGGEGERTSTGRFKFVPHEGLDVACPLPDDMRQLVSLVPSLTDECSKLGLI